MEVGASVFWCAFVKFCSSKPGSPASDPKKFGGKISLSISCFKDTNKLIAMLYIKQLKKDAFVVLSLQVVIRAFDFFEIMFLQAGKNSVHLCPASEKAVVF